MHENNRKYVTWTIFGFIATVAITIMAVLGNIAISAQDMSQDNRVDIKELQTNYKNIDQKLTEIKEDIKLLRKEYNPSKR